MRLEPYLFFNGRTEEALAFYREAIGAETLFLLRFKDSPEGRRTPARLAGEGHARDVQDRVERSSWRPTA